MRIPSIKKALKSASSAIHFRDNSDYKKALYEVIAHLTGKNPAKINWIDVGKVFKSTHPELQDNERVDMGAFKPLEFLEENISDLIPDERKKAFWARYILDWIGHIKNVSGQDLDNIGKEAETPRKLNEPDDDYRSRLKEFLTKCTVRRLSQISRGEELDRYGELFGMKRKEDPVEPDSDFRERILKHLTSNCGAGTNLEKVTCIICEEQFSAANGPACPHCGADFSEETDA